MGEPIRIFFNTSTRIFGDTDESHRVEGGGEVTVVPVGGDILTARIASEAAWVSEQILKYLCDLMIFLTS